jgi:EAL domain-containing protein (putative c-di-GMP-specific phosphodiesterase class I)/PAS domain-containing protein
MAIDTTPKDPIQGTRSERDRFVAFAFCWADALFELNEDQEVTFVAGATEALIGCAAGELMGKNFMDLVEQSDRTLTQQLINIAKKRGRIENATIRLVCKDKKSSPLSFAGYRLGDFGDHFFLALRSGATSSTSATGKNLSRDSESGLYTAETFSELASQQIKEAKEAGVEAEVSLVSMPDIEKLKDRLDDDAEKSLVETVSASLRASSINGDAAAEVGDGKFALVHDASINVQEIQDQLSQATKEIDPTGEGIEAEAASFEIGDDDVDDADLANGLMFAINKFKTNKGSDFSLSEFTSNLSGMVDDAMHSVQEFRDIVANGKFKVAFHPIIHIATGEIHHYEALVWFDNLAEGVSPYETITFAEEVGLIWQFDLAMAKKVIEWLFENRDKDYSIAVNISGNSITNMNYLKGLQELLKLNFWARGKLLFEITESSRIADLATANRFFQTLRDEGYEVCLDDFGAGAASFQYLASLEVDVVKLDGSAVKNALVAKKGKAFMTALARLCRDIDVETIAEFIDDENTLNFVRECGVDYVQGFMFGEPSTKIEVFEEAGQIVRSDT